MHSEIQKTLELCYNSITEIPKNIKNIFENFYGKENVDVTNNNSDHFYTFDEFYKSIKSINLYSIVQSASIKLKNPLDEIEDEFTINEVKDLFNNKETLNKILDYLKIKKFDFKSYYVMVYFPTVKVTNENNKSVILHNLYAKTLFDKSGRMLQSFHLNKSSYTIDQYYSDYMHSHVPGISSDFYSFMVPCLGTGPIRTTIGLLYNDYREDLWLLYCLELKKYVETESLEGVPYKKLEYIGLNNVYDVQLSCFYIINNIGANNTTQTMIKTFTTYLLENKLLKFNYDNNMVSIAYSFPQYIITISNIFIEWHNKLCREPDIKVYTLFELVNNNIIKRGIITTNKVIIKNKRNSDRDIIGSLNSILFKFKGKDVKLTLENNSGNTTNNECYLLNPDFAMFILTKILYFLNYNLNENTDSTSNFGKRIKYL